MGICYTVPNASVGVVERFGKFRTLHNPGLNCLWCFCGVGDVLAGFESLRLRQLDVRVETKTKDNVFIVLVVSVQYQVDRQNIEIAHYRLSNAEQQITAFVFDAVRASVPKMNLDDAFEQKDEVARTVRTELSEAMSGFGFQIQNTLITDIEPDANVKRAMNEINAARRLRDAATDRAEAEKILVVKAAEADAESKYLSGTGVARQRKAIVDGLRESVMAFSDSVEGTNAKDVMDLVLLTQYFDTLKDIGANSKTNIAFIPHTPNSVTSLRDQVRDGFMQGMLTTHQ
eukprot:m.125057 g.125057  ORF g.125057 m.125057 type:complete len:287 (+) comp16644_c1_seq2:320-1180(+)